MTGEKLVYKREIGSLAYPSIFIIYYIKIAMTINQWSIFKQRLPYKHGNYEAKNSSANMNKSFKPKPQE